MIEMFIPPVPREKLLAWNFFDLYPPDGGGCHLFYQLAGSTDDLIIAEAVLEKDILGPFGGVENCQFRRLEYWRSVEMSCWLNRLYVLVPLAKYFLVRGSSEAGKVLKNLLFEFIRQCPPPLSEQETLEMTERVNAKRALYNQRSHQENQKDNTDLEYIWYDFQPASRIIHILYTLYLLRNSEVFSDSEIQKINNVLIQHGRVVYWAEKAAFPRQGDNHQSVRALSLLYMAAAFPHVPEAGQWLEKGASLSLFHGQNDFFDDGFLKEISPSYHLFQCWHLRDACFLTEQLGRPEAPEFLRLLKKAASAAALTAEPDGKTPVINDGAPLNAAAFLQTLSFPDKPEAQDGWTHLKDAGLSALRFRSGKLWALADGSVWMKSPSHYHPGKMGLHLWMDGTALIGECGCCSYDDVLFAEWYKKAEAHSSLLLNGRGDGSVRGLYNTELHAQIERWTLDNGIRMRLTSNNRGWENALWTREFSLRPGSETVFRVNDLLETSQESEFLFVWICRPGITAGVERDCVVLSAKERNFLVNIQGNTQISLAADSVKFCHNFQHVSVNRILVKGKSFREKPVRITTEFSGMS